jgi:type I restriction enzyme, R subunit
MRQAIINENADLVAENARYVMRITGSDKDGQDQLGKFIDPESKYPVLVTTSRLLSTGIDAQTCRLIVLDRAVASMTEFKQIAGRGTRVHEDTRKFFFTLIDFRGATDHFADPDFDGDPVQIYEPGESDPITPPDDTAQDGDDTAPPTRGDDETVLDEPGFSMPPGGPTRKIYADGVSARVIVERIEYLDENGRLVTESLRDFTKSALKKCFVSLDNFLKRWKSAECKQAIIEELEAEGLALDAISEEPGRNLICHVAFDKKPLTRREPADNVKKRDVLNKINGIDFNTLADRQHFGEIYEQYDAGGPAGGREKAAAHMLCVTNVLLHGVTAPYVAKVDALMALCGQLEASLTATTCRRLLDALLAEALVPEDVAELEAAE